MIKEAVQVSGLKSYTMVPSADKEVREDRLDVKLSRLLHVWKIHTSGS